LFLSALYRAEQKFSYGETNLTNLAASYAYGIARNHPFLDGNKRTAFVVAYTFLEINGLDFYATNAEVYETIANLAAGKVSEEELAEWFYKHARDK
jgi:death on curing protein